MHINISAFVFAILLNSRARSFRPLPYTRIQSTTAKSALFPQPRVRDASTAASKVAATNSPITNDELGPETGGGGEESKASVGGKYLAINSYTELLDKRPITTKSVSAGIISALGDLLAQLVEAKVSGVPFALNWVRLNAFAISGGAFVGPYVHLWYEWLWVMGRWLERKFNATKGWQTLAQVLIDQTLGVAVFFPAYFFVYEYTEAAVALRGFGAPVASAATAKMRNELMSVILTNYYLWPVFNWISFSCVPEKLRVLTSNIVSVFWNAFLCSRIP